MTDEAPYIYSKECHIFRDDYNEELAYLHV